MEIEHLPLPGAALIRPKRHGDARGWFSETWREDVFEAAGLPSRFPQDNHAFSAQCYTLRGLHFQVPPYAQGKLVRCTKGRIFDVLVDLRRRSGTFGHWLGEELGAENGKQLYIPEGFAHGYLTLEPDTEVQYKVTSPYAPEAERGLAWDDPDLAIKWPLNGSVPALSGKDRSLPSLSVLGDPFVELA